MNLPQQLHGWPLRTAAPELCWDHGGTGLGLLDADLNIVSGNASFFSLLGHTRSIGSNLLALAGFKTRAMEHIQAILRARGHWKGMAHSAELAIRIEIDAAFAPDTDSTHYCVALIDYTDDCIQYRNLAAARQQAEKTDRAKSQFLSHMSHELRTPLNAILGFTQLLALSPHLDALEQDNVQEIESAGRYLLNLINEILDLAKIESGKLKLNEDVISLHALFDECAALMSALARNRPVQLEQSVPPELQLTTDHVRLKQVVINLLSNAIKYNVPDGNVVLRGALTQQQTLRIEIQDSGRGIAPERQEAIFSPFERLGGDDRTIEGTGIGLMITRRLVKLMQGDIGVFSEPGRGSVFWLEFPLIEAEGAQDSAAAAHGFSELPCTPPVHACWLGGDERLLTLLDGLKQLRPNLALYRYAWPLPDRPLYPQPDLLFVAPDQLPALAAQPQLCLGLKHSRVVVVGTGATIPPPALAPRCLPLAPDCKLTTLLTLLDNPAADGECP